MEKGKPEGEKLGWRLLATEYPLVTPWLRIRRDRVAIDGKGEITYTYMQGTGAVVVVPVTSEGEMVLVKQYRYTVDDWCLEVPAGGTHDTGDKALDQVARDELRQEIGAECDNLRYVGWFYASVGSSSQPFHVYLALDVRLTATQQHEETEHIEVLQMPARDALALVKAGEMRNGVSALSVLLCEPLLRELGYV
jgi:ADP-ribose pyrophosphatase